MSTQWCLAAGKNDEKHTEVTDRRTGLGYLVWIIFELWKHTHNSASFVECSLMSHWMLLDWF